MRIAKLYMDTVVEIEAHSDESAERLEARMNRAFEAFRRVEDACSRFDPDSELMRACRQPNVPVPLGPYAFEPLKFALAVAQRTDGLVDPTIGGRLEARGFNRRYLTGELVRHAYDETATYRDVELDERKRTVLLRKPLVLDLGAVAKGFAIDLAVRELREIPRFLVNAGGDLFAGGADESRNAWTIGIRHPYRKSATIRTLELRNEAICTSGSYERKSDAAEGEHHLVDPIAGRSPNEWISCSVIAPFAMLADAFSTAAFLRREDEARELLEEAGLRGLLISPELAVATVGGI